jgi:hypothetical protein
VWINFSSSRLFGLELELNFQKKAAASDSTPLWLFPTRVYIYIYIHMGFVWDHYLSTGFSTVELIDSCLTNEWLPRKYCLFHFILFNLFYWRVSKGPPDSKQSSYLRKIFLKTWKNCFLQTVETSFTLVPVLQWMFIVYIHFFNQHVLIINNCTT